MIKISDIFFIENEEAEFEVLFKKYLAWKDSQKPQIDGYEYERSFVKFTYLMNRQLFGISQKCEHWFKRLKKNQTSLVGTNAQ